MDALKEYLNDEELFSIIIAAIQIHIDCKDLWTHLIQIKTSKLLRLMSKIIDHQFKINDFEKISDIYFEYNLEFAPIVNKVYFSIYDYLSTFIHQFSDQLPVRSWLGDFIDNLNSNSNLDTNTSKLIKFIAMGKHFNQLNKNWQKRKALVRFKEAFTNYYKNRDHKKMQTKTATNVFISGRFGKHIALFI